MSPEGFPQPQPQETRTSREVPPLSTLEKFEKEPRTKRFVCLSDIHNDINAMRASLRQRELIDEDDEWKHNLADVHLMVAGDSINKHNPNPEVVKFLKHLQKSAPEGCRVTVLVGNHELDILMRETEGEDAELDEKRFKFMGKMQVVSKQGQILFLHRYPSLALIEELEAQYRQEGGAVSDKEWYINERFRQAVVTRKITPEKSHAVFQECDDGGNHNALEGLNEEEYYKQNGKRISALLKRMGVSIVVHGHKRQISGGQHFERYIPGIAMINIDTAMSNDKNPEGEHITASTEFFVSPEGVSISSIYRGVENPQGSTFISSPGQKLH